MSDNWGGEASRAVADGFIPGAKIKRVRHGSCGNIKEECIYTISKITSNIGSFCNVYVKEEPSVAHLMNFDLVEIINEDTKEKQGEATMNEFIARLFPKTEDAVLVYKYFSAKINSKYDEIIAVGREQAILAAAKEMKAAEELANKK